MKAVKGFAKTCYSEVLISDTASTVNEQEDGSLVENTSEDAAERTYLGGLGLKFKFPGDPKK
jgi:hypothetical protein